MAIRAKCGTCGKVYSLKDEYAGKRIRCPACKEPLLVPGTPSGAGAAPKAGAAARGGTSTTRRPPPPRAQAPKRPPPPKKKRQLVQAADRVDPNRTAYTPSPAARGAGKGGVKAATVCPACGKAMDPKAVTCGNCGYHTKLRRRMAITAAIKNTDRAPGVRADGSRYVTRAEKAEIRVAQGRKVRLGLVVFIILLAGTALGVGLTMRYYIRNGLPLEEQRLEVLPPLYRPLDADGKPNPDYDPDRPLTSPSHFHPYCVGMRVELDLPLSSVHWEKRVIEEPVKGAAAASRLAALCRLPYYKTRSRVILPRVMAAIRRLRCSFDPESLERGVMLTDDAVVVWRQGAKPADRGYLTGALLDFGQQQDAVRKLLTGKRAAGSRLHVSGRLTFIVSRMCEQCTGGYACALRRGWKLQEKLDRIPPASEGFKVQAGDDPLADKLVFHPVVVVKDFKLVKGD